MLTRLGRRAPGTGAPRSIVSIFGVAALFLGLLAPVGASAQSFRFGSTSETILFDPAAAVVAFDFEVTIEELPSPGAPHLTQAFSFGLSHDDALFSVDSVSPAGALASLGGGAGPDFFGVSLYPGGTTVGCLYAFDLSSSLSFSPIDSVATLDCTTTGSLAGTTDPTMTLPAFSDALGSPPVLNTVVVDVAEYVPVFAADFITFEPDLPPEFMRGDLDANGVINLVDVIRVLLYLFEGGVETCDDALDVDDNGAIELTDAVVQLEYMFTSGPAPASPFGSCGPDPTDADALGCDSYPVCE